MKAATNRTENRAAAALLLALSLLPILQMAARLLSGSGGIPDYDIILRQLTLWTALASGMICSREGQHIKLGFKDNLPEGRLRSIAGYAIAFTGAAVSIAAALAGFSFSLIGFDPQQTAGLIPIRYLSMIIPAAFAVIGIRFVTRTDIKAKGLCLAAGTAAGLLLGLPSISGLLYLTPLQPPLWLDSALDAYYIFFGATDWLFTIILIVLTVFGLPIFLLLGGAAFILFAGSWGVPEVIPNEVYNLLTGSAIPAIPLFTLTGFILSEGKTGNRLVALFQAFLGRMPGGLAVMSVVVCAFFTTFTGASGVTILALGGLLSFILIKSGEYTENFTKGLLTSSGSIGLLFPPSLPIIMYGIQAQISIKDMFIAGIIPGFVLVAALSVMGIVHAARHRGSCAEAECIEDPPGKLESLRKAAGDLALPVVILLFYFGGITTLVETGAVAVAYALVMELLIYRDLKIRDIMTIMKKTAPVIGGVLMILAMAKGLSYYIVDAEVPMMLTAFFGEHVESPLLFLLLLNGVLLITGCLMDIFSAIMVVAPLVIPLGELYGINPVQLGIIFLANLQLGYLTPPVGLNLFLASYAFETPLAKIYKGVVPFFIVLLLMVLLITYVPWFSLALL